MAAIRADALASLSTGGTGFIGCKLMRRTTFVGRATAFAGDLTLLFAAHRGKSTGFLSAFFIWHC
jgi:hypothetical protein